MAKIDDLKINVTTELDAKRFEKQLELCTIKTNELNIALKKLSDITVNMNVVINESKSRPSWWEFWK